MSDMPERLRVYPHAKKLNGQEFYDSTPGSGWSNDCGYIRDDLYESLKAENERLRTELDKRKWQPIETAPRDGTRIIVNQSNTMFHKFAEVHWGQAPNYKIGWVGHDNEGTYLSKNPTHWMPLPDAPAADAAEVG